MTLRVRLLSSILLLLAGMFLTPAVFAQRFDGTHVALTSSTLSAQFKAYEIWRIDVKQFDAYVKKENGTYGRAAQLNLGKHQWRLELTPSNIIGPNYKLQVLTTKGLQVSQPTEVKAFEGTELNGYGQVRLTVDDDFISGFVMEGQKRWYIEPLWHHDFSAARDLFVVYDRDQVIFDGMGTCGAEELEENRHIMSQKQEKSHPGAESNALVRLEYAIASDRSMFNKYGSVTAVENHNITVVNNVEGDYTGNFNNDLCIDIVTQFVVTGTDPWTNSTDAGTLLASFRTWGNAGNFGISFDDAGLWSNRDFDGGTIGIAYLNGICNTLKYHCLQDFSSNSEFLRVLNSHEMGHNFSCTHDAAGSNTIMAPSVSAATAWSSQSVSQFNGYTQPLINNGCLGSCGAPPPPLVADFSWSPDPGCVNQPIQFTDQSTGQITGRSWVFPGGTPATSTQTNPVVTWSTAGVKSVSLTLTGAGGPVTTTKQVTINPLPTANFTSTVAGLTVTFNSTSTNATLYSWDFGDGNTSNEEDPVHTYTESGNYTVILTVSNDCGTATKTLLVITAPTADFTATPTEGCTALTVQFQNQSSTNAVSYQWQFPGGVPSTSNQQNPTVTYYGQGNFNVTLTAINSSGTHTVTRNSYIKTLLPPSPGFSHAANGLNVSFFNTSTSATSYSWNFGDGGTSTLTNPTHMYPSAGTYTVTLTASNAYCSETTTETITVQSGLTASFSATPTNGCAPLNVQYTSTSAGTGTLTYAWQFQGGTPGSSTAQNPSVLYSSPGTYSVTLTVSNGSSTATATQQSYIKVYSLPTAAFTDSTVNLTAFFTNTSTSGGAPSMSYHWSFGDDSTSTATNPVHTYAADGVYNVRLISTNQCGSDTSIQQVTIVTPPTANFTASPTTGCAPLTVQFQSTSSTNAVTYSWEFPGGTPATSSAQNPAVVYSAPGTYSVTLTVGNSAGTSSATQQSYITVGTVPTAGFSSSTSGTTVTFTNSSTGATSYEWNFGDGNGSTAANPTHSYATDGIYTVILSATNACGTVTSTQQVTIVTPPTANFTANPTTGCAPLTVQFQSTSSTNAVTYSWEFPGGTPATSSAQNPSVVYSAPGTYSVTLTVGNSAGTSSATQQNYITVGTVPTAGFSNSGNGATYTFNNSSTGATSYEWNFGDGNGSTATNPTHTYSADGTYTVTLTATNACGTATSTSTVTVVTPPTANFNASVTTGCAPLTVTFNNSSSSNATNFAWDFPGGTPSSSTEQNPTVTYAAPGIYSVTLTASNAAGSSTFTQQSYIVVGTVPAAGFNASVNGATANFNNTTAGGTSFTWDFGDGSSSAAPSPSHTYASDGTYTVVLTATNNCGTATFSQNVVIITSPNAGFTAQTTTGCATLTVQFQDLSSNNTTNWEWTFPGGDPATSTEQNPTVNYGTPGVYDVTLVATGPGGTSTYTQPGFITVLSTPTAGFSSSVTGTTASFTNASTNATQYLWNFGDGSNSAAENPTHTYAADGVYTVTLTASNNCGSTTFTQTVTIATPPTANFSQSTASGCGPLTVQFGNQSSSNTTSVSWTFPGGDPASSTAQNPTVVYAAPGTYTVTLTASNSAGTSTSTSMVTVLPLPTPGFGTLGGNGLTVSFTNTSTNATSYSWAFGDGNTSTQTAPTHTYAVPGTYTVTLTASNACGSATTTQQVTVQGSAPTAQFMAGETAGCLPLLVAFTDQSTGAPTAWKWSFPGGNPSSSTQQNPVVSYTTPGTFDVTLEVTNPFGTSTITKPNYITVQGFPSTNFAYTTSSGTVTFTNTSTNALSYSWNFGDGSAPSTEANPTHTYTTTGTYTVELTAVNNCGAATLQQQVMVTITAVNEVNWLDAFRLYPNPNDGHFRVEMNGPAHAEVEFTLLNALGQPVRREVADFGSGTLSRDFEYSSLAAGVYALRVQAGTQSVVWHFVVAR